MQRIELTRRVAIAAAQYLEQYPEPKTPAELADHNCIVYQPSGPEWHFIGLCCKNGTPSLSGQSNGICARTYRFLRPSQNLSSGVTSSQI
ncbi:MAG: hypothetical protein AAF810_00685 [Cyanobacteria bacterium P01_D01_bin.36]